MAELGATVAGLLSLTITVIGLSNRYFSNAKKAPRTIKGYFRELEALKLLLVDFKALKSQGLSTATTTALEGCHSELERLRTKLQKRNSTNAFSNAVHRLTWPFAEEETRHLVEVVHRYLDVFHAALSVDNVKLGATTLEAVTRNETRAIYMERRRVLSWLSAANPYSNQTAARDKYGASTGDWLFESSEFLKWHQNGKSSIWLTGIPGAGKTILCSTVIEFLQRSPKVNEAVLIWYFDFSDDHKQSLDALLRSLLSQACEILDTIPSEVMDLFETNNGHPRHLSLDRRTLLDLLKNIFASFEAVTIVIDALDESSEVSGVLSFFHDLNGTDFENVKWLVTSRQKQEIEDSLLGTQTAVMPLENAFVDADIRCYLGDCLTRDPKLSSKPARIKQQIEDVLTEKAHGMFRWIECQLEVIRRCRTAPAIELALRTLPETLDATYERILQSIDHEDREHAHRALELLAFSKRPLQVEEVAEAIIIVPGCKPFDVDDRFFDLKDVLSICAGLVKRVQDSNDLVLAHYSVQEFLLSHRIHQSTAAYFGLDHQLSQTRIAEACLTYLLSFQGVSALYSGIEDDYPFLEYAAQHWFEHVNPGTTDSSSMLTSLIFNLMRHWEHSEGNLDWSQFLDEDLFYDYELKDTYVQVLGWQGGRGIESAITLMCSLQRLDVAISLLEAGRPFHSHGHACGTLLQFAIEESNMSILDRIIAAGCSLDAPLLDGDSALYIAAKKGDSTMMTKLIDLGTHTHRLASHRFHDHGLDFKMEFGALLHVAARYRRPDIMKILLEAIADVNAVAGKHDSLLSTILWDTTAPLSRSVQMVKLLTEAGTDVNAHEEYWGTPMHTLLCRLFPPQAITHDVERILSKIGINLNKPFLEYQILVYNLAYTMKNVSCGTSRTSQTTLAGLEAQTVTRDIRVEDPCIFDIAPVVKILLSAGADPNARGRLYPGTVRSIANRYSGHGLWERFEMLHKAGASLANLESLGPRTGTPLQAVCCLPFESADTVMALLEAGADPNLCETETESPLNMAIKRGYKSIIKTLEAAGAGFSFSQSAEEIEQPTSNTEEFEIDVTKGKGAESPIRPRCWIL